MKRYQKRQLKDLKDLSDKSTSFKGNKIDTKENIDMQIDRKNKINILINTSTKVVAIFSPFVLFFMYEIISIIAGNHKLSQDELVNSQMLTPIIIFFSIFISSLILLFIKKNKLIKQM